MQRTMEKKLLTVVVSAVLVFMTCVPVPSGRVYVDRGRYDEAQAAVPIVVVGGAVVFGTLLAAYGIYVVGTNSAAYEANLNSLYNDYATYNGLTSEQMESKMAEYVTSDGKIDIARANSDALFNSLPDYVQQNITNGNMSVGDNSASGRIGAVTIGSAVFKTYSSVPEIVSMADEKMSSSAGAGLPLIAYKISYNSYQNVDEYWFYYADESQSSKSFNESGSAIIRGKVYSTSVNYNRSSMSYTVNSRVWGPRSESFQSSSIYLNPDVDWTIPNYNTVTGLVDTGLGIVSSAVADGTATFPDVVVEPFEPTAEQLEAGYSTADVIAAINSGNAVLDGILDAVNNLPPLLRGILTPLLEILTYVSGGYAILNNLVAGPFTWLSQWWQILTGWWNSLLEWLGSTSFENVMNTVIDGVQAIPDGIRNLGDRILDGLGALPGALGLDGVLGGILDGVLSIPGVLEGLLSGVLDGVLAIPGEIALVVQAVTAWIHGSCRIRY